ncbi:MAG: WG repeat-containing protein [Bacteroidia bacterium]|nr:WG repeat-containing protein [Bacteroidia bacterium]
MKEIVFIIFWALTITGYAQRIPDRIPIYQNTGWGFCDTSKKIVIPCIYRKVFFFNGEYAAVLDSFAYWGFINKKGEEIIKPKYETVDGFKNGFCRVKADDGYGFLNSSMKEALPCKLKETCEDVYDYFKKEGIAICNKQVFDTAGKISVFDLYEETGVFSEGLLWVTKNRKGGFVNKNLEAAIPLSDFSEGESKPVFTEGLCGLRKNGFWGYIDKSGKEAIPFEYDAGSPFVEGRAVVGKKWKWGLIDKSGKEIVPLTYDYVQSYFEGMAVVVKNDKYGFVDINGKVVIPCQYHRAYNFIKGYAMALHLAKYFIIDNKGKKVSKDYEFMMYVTKGEFYQTTNKKKCGVVDYNGKELIPCIYKDVPYYSYELNLGIVQNDDGKYGMINNKGKFIIPCVYDYLEMRSGTLIYVEQMNLDGKGRVVKNVYVGDKLCPNAWMQQGFFDLTGKKYFD